MIIIIYNKSVKELSQLIGSDRKTVPAGGTTTATNGLLGVSLLKLVFRVSRDCFTEDKLEETKKRLKQAQQSFLDLMEEDIESFEKNLQEDFENDELRKKIIDTPLKIAQTSTDILNLAYDLQDIVKDNVRADYEVAIENLKASKRGALSIIKSNYQFFADNAPYLKKVKNMVKEIE